MGFNKLKNGFGRVAALSLAAVVGFIAFSFDTEARDRFREMELAKPHYIKRDAEDWDAGGRIIGVVKHPNKDMTVEFYRADHLVYTFKAPGTMNIYMSKILPSGIYKLVFKSTGFHDETVRKIRIKSGFDCVLDVVMGLHVYNN